MGTLSWIISAASSLAACIAAFIAYRNHTIARRSIALAEQQAIGKHPVIMPYLIDGFVKQLVDRGKTIYAFSVSLSNPSDTINSLARIELAVTYYRPNQPLATLLLPHDPALAPELGISAGLLLAQTHQIAGHCTIA